MAAGPGLQPPEAAVRAALLHGGESSSEVFTATSATEGTLARSRSYRSVGWAVYETVGSGPSRRAVGSAIGSSVIVSGAMSRAAIVIVRSS